MAEHWNDGPKPLVWRKTAEEIIEKVRRGRTALHQVHAAPLVPELGAPSACRSLRFVR